MCGHKDGFGLSRNQVNDAMLIGPVFLGTYWLGPLSSYIGDRLLSCSIDWSRISSVNQIDLKLRVNLLPLPPVATLPVSLKSDSIYRNSLYSEHFKNTFISLTEASLF